MTVKPLIWHYGLMAERWAKHIHDAPEIPFYEKAIKEFGQPVLDLACGTGRILLPLLRAGYEVDGCDISRDMLHHCRKTAASEGYSPDLYEQPMQAFDLPHRYKTIYICGSFGLAGSLEDDQATLQRCYDHLEDGGGLLLNIDAEYALPDSWALWLKENRQKLPQEWPKEGDRLVAQDGSDNIAYFRTVHLDPLEQTYTRQVRLEKWISGEMVASEEYTLRGNMYFKNEVLLRLKMAGFQDIAVFGDYTEEMATAEHKELIFRALK